MKQDLQKRLSEVLERQTQTISDLESLLDLAGVPSDPTTALRSWLGRMAIDHMKLKEELRRHELASVNAWASSDKAARQFDLVTDSHIVEFKTQSDDALLSDKQPLREVILGVLDLIGVPSTPHTIAQVSSSIGHKQFVNPSRFASLRRDEKASYYRDPKMRQSWLVPALSARDYSALPRLVSVSTWSLESRIISEETLRINNLKTVLRIAERFASRETKNGKAIDRLRPMLLRLCNLHHLSFDGSLSLEQICLVVRNELDLIEERDLDRRRVAVDSLKLLPESVQLWGKPVESDLPRESLDL